MSVNERSNGKPRPVEYPIFYGQDQLKIVNFLWVKLRLTLRSTRNCSIGEPFKPFDSDEFCRFCISKWIRVNSRIWSLKFEEQDFNNKNVLSSSYFLLFNMLQAFAGQTVVRTTEMLWNALYWDFGMLLKQTASKVNRWRFMVCCSFGHSREEDSSRTALRSGPAPTRSGWPLEGRAIRRLQIFINIWAFNMK